MTSKPALPRAPPLPSYPPVAPPTPEQYEGGGAELITSPGAAGSGADASFSAEEAVASGAPISFYYSDGHEAEEQKREEEQGEEEVKKTDYLCVVLKTLAGIVVFVGLSTLLQELAGDKITEVSIVFVEKVGLLGVFLLVFLCDGLPQPFTYLPIVYMAVEGAVPRPVVFAVVAGASWAACVFGYGLGRFFRRPGPCRSCFDRQMDKYPSVPDLMMRKGNWGVVAAGFLPLPLPIATYAAGFFGVDFRWFLVAALCRAPKIAAIVALCPGPEPDTERLLFL